MRREELETFLAVAERGTVAAAAEHLYISQSTASGRIDALEREVGHPLIERHRGARTAPLTPAGAELVPIARSIIDLAEAARHVGDAPHRAPFSLAAADSLNSVLLIPFYRAFVAAHPDIVLELNTMLSAEVNRAVDEHRTMAGIAFEIDRYPSLTSRELFRDPWRIVCDRDAPFARSGDPGDLEGDREVLTHYSAEFQTWHRHYFAHFTHPLLVVGNAAQLGVFLNEPRAWCIAPRSSARGFMSENPHLIARPMPEEPPARIAHLIYRRDAPPETRRLVTIFEHEVRAYLADLEALA